MSSKTPLNGVMFVVGLTSRPSKLLGGHTGVRFACSDCGKKFSVWLGEKVPKCPCWTRVEPGYWSDDKTYEETESGRVGNKENKDVTD